MQLLRERYVVIPRKYGYEQSAKVAVQRRVGGRIFESCDISLENTPTSQAVSL